VNTSKKKKQVTFRLGADGNEWCWVMGESPDNTIENMEIDYQNEQKQLKYIIDNILYYFLI
jgi:hypothetical protein